MDLRFSNTDSSVPFSFQIEGKRSEFWTEFEKNFQKVILKPTDLNFIKIFLIERDLEDYSLRNQIEIDNIMSGFYLCKLRDNATKGFLKWVDKQNK